MQALLASLLTGLIVLLAGCGNQLASVSIHVPVFPDEEKPEESKSDMECVLYFDNTQSMAGFVRAANSDFIRSTDSIYELMTTWTGGRSFWHLDKVAVKDEEGQVMLDQYGQPITALNWKKLPLQEKFKEAYKHPNSTDDKCFYTYNRGSFASGMGPLQLLFPETPSQNTAKVDFSKVNIFITDMAEQNKECMDLAKNLQEVVKGYENHSVTLFALKSNFTGRASVADSGTVDPKGGPNMVSEYFTNEELPFYIIVIGPTQDALKFSYNLRTSFFDAKKIPYHYTAFLSNGGLQMVSADEIKVARMVGLAGDELTALSKGRLTANNSNETIQLTKRDRSFLYPNDTTSKRDQTALYFTLDQQKKDLHQAVLNIYFPLPSLLDPNGSGVETISATYQDFSAAGADIACGLTNAQDKPREQVVLKYSDIVKGPPPEDSTTSRPATTSGNSTVAVTTVIAAQRYDWSVATPDQCRLYIETVVSVLPQGTKVPRMVAGSDVSFAKQTAYVVTSANGAVHLQLKLRNTETLRSFANNGYISVRLPVTAVMRMPQETPEWVSEWTYYASESTNPNEKFLKTEGLDSFFYVMNGTFGDAQNRPEWRKIVLDLAVDIKIGA